MSTLTVARTFTPAVTRYRSDDTSKLDVYLMSSEDEFNQAFAHLYFNRNEIWECEGLHWVANTLTPMCFQLHREGNDPLLFVGKQFLFYHRGYISPIDRLGKAPWIIEIAARDADLSIEHFRSLASYQQSKWITGAVSKYLSVPENAKSFESIAYKIVVQPES